MDKLGGDDEIWKWIFTLLAVSPFLAMRSAPTTVASIDVIWVSLSNLGRTDSMDGFVLEKRADHGVAYHGGGDGECVELQGGQSMYASVLIGEGFYENMVTEIPGDTGLFGCNTPSRGVPVRVDM